MIYLDLNMSVIFFCMSDTLTHNQWMNLFTEKIRWVDSQNVFFAGELPLLFYVQSGIRV